MDGTVKGGANLMAEILRRTLLELETLGKLPTNNPVLYLQMDNCSENKNSTVFSFLSHLVEQNVFTEVYVGFLMVGHTHEDIDQFFSTISSWLKKLETICPDIPSFKEAVVQAFMTNEKMEKQKPAVIYLNAFDVHDYDVFYDKLKNKHLAHHSKPHQFRFKRFSDSVLCHYKMWAADAEYLPTLSKLLQGVGHSSPAPILQGVGHSSPAPILQGVFSRSNTEAKSW